MKAPEDPLVHQSFYRDRGHTWTVQVYEGEAGYRAEWSCPDVDNADVYSNGGFATIGAAGSAARVMIRSLPPEAYEANHDAK